jgi:2-polyprenyl-3-methyl-5-hydroxy-6-metoxy-1,4-benzoquinol methylase
MTATGDVVQGEAVALVTAGGEVLDLDVDRWHADVDDVEAALLATLPDPVLDVGCGPGRIVAALAAAGGALFFWRRKRGGDEPST